MSKPTALVTNALEFAGPPAVGALQDAGFHVIAHDVSFTDPEARSRYVKAHPNVCAIVQQDAAQVIDAAYQVNQRLDVLVSNDAYPPIHTSIASANIDDLRATLERLVVFPFALAKAAIPRLIAQNAARVVMITSNRTRLPMQNGAIPDAARDALNALVKSLSLELAPHGVPVNAIAPNFLYSETYYPRAKFIDNPAGRDFVSSTVPVGRLADPAEIGELVVYLATMKGNFMTGAIIDFSGGWPMAAQRPAL